MIFNIQAKLVADGRLASHILLFGLGVFPISFSALSALMNIGAFSMPVAMWVDSNLSQETGSEKS